MIAVIDSTLNMSEHAIRPRDIYFKHGMILLAHLMYTVHSPLDSVVTTFAFPYSIPASSFGLVFHLGKYL